MPKEHKEQDIQSSIINYIKSIGGLPIKQNQIGIYAQAGVPDIIACINGKFVAIEVKRPGQKPKPIQEVFLNTINKCGGIAFWADNLNIVKEKIRTSCN
jgi:Holliday junction resolvase